ncbi:MAG: hypothetical protein Q9166_007251 [cf. Caloplaca sp. 2 TL-2023]
MPSYWENQRPIHNNRDNGPPVRNNYSDNLATKLDPALFGKMISNGAESSKATGKQVKSASTASTASKTRQQKIAEFLGDPGPKGIIKDGKLTWTSPSQASSSKHVPSVASTLPAAQTSPTKTNNLSAASSQRSGVPLPSRAVAERSSAVSASQASPFPCPYTDCARGFQKEADLRKHKNDEHDYCKVCDEDFEDDEAFHKHKIMSERHITCTVCSIDFKSEMGRDRHYNVTHAAAHNVRCRGCDTTFAKGAALLVHFERNQCRPKDKDGISADSFEAQRAAMAMVMQTKINEKEAEAESRGGSFSRLGAVPFGGSVAASSIYGGVPIEASEQPDFLTDHDHESRSLKYPSLSQPSTAESTTTERPGSPAESDAETDLLSFDNDRQDALNASNLAALNQGYGYGDWTPKASLADWPLPGKKKDIVEDMSNMSMSSSKIAANLPQIPSESGVYAPPSVQPSKSGYSVSGELQKGIELQPNAITGEWECPYYKCGFKGLLRQDLEAHFDNRDNGHRGFEHQCPSCLKRFKTASAMMAHLESPTIRCTIRDSKGFGNILHLVSGGNINLAGRHNDGSNRLVVPKDGKAPEDMW